MSDTPTRAYLRILARDYLWYITEMASGAHDADARRVLSAQRSLVHDELIRVLGDDYARPFDMQAYARQLCG